MALILWAYLFVSTALNFKSETKSTDTTPKYDSKDVKKDSVPLIEYSFYEKVYWKYHCGKKPDKNNRYLDLDSSRIIFISANGDKKDCFVIYPPTDCGESAGSSGADAVFFKRKKNGSYFIQSFFVTHLQKLPTSHNGIFDLSGILIKSYNVEYYYHWNGHEFVETEAIVNHIPVDIWRKMFTTNDTIEPYNLGNHYGIEDFRKWDTVMVNPNTRGIIAEPITPDLYVFENTKGINYRFLCHLNSALLHNIRFSKDMTHNYYDIMVESSEHRYVKQSDTSFCHYKEVWQYDLKTKQYQYAYLAVDTCLNYEK
jgi:hypothetical protein